MKPKYSRSALKFAKILRREQTAAEKELWGRLRNRALGGLKFRRQQPVGNYIVDFFCAERSLIIEVDGASHIGRRDNDRKRQRWLESEGYKVLRIMNTDVHRRIDVVLGEILRACESGREDPHPNPSPLKGVGLKTRD